MSHLLCSAWSFSTAAFPPASTPSSSAVSRPLPPRPEWTLLHRLRRCLLAAAATLFVLAYLLAVKSLRLPLYGSASNWIGIVGFTLIDLFAAALILECIHPRSPLARVLTLRPLRALGVISYGFYVYHDLLHDLFALAAHRLVPRYPIFATAAVALVGTLAISILSYQLLEKPFLKLKGSFSIQVHRAPTA